MKTFSLAIVLKDGSKKDMRIEARRRVDAFLDMAIISATEGWESQIARVDIWEAA